MLKKIYDAYWVIRPYLDMYKELKGEIGVKQPQVQEVKTLLAAGFTPKQIQYFRSTVSNLEQ